MRERTEDWRMKVLQNSFVVTLFVIMMAMMVVPNDLETIIWFALCVFGTVLSANLCSFALFNGVLYLQAMKLFQNFEY